MEPRGRGHPDKGVAGYEEGLIRMNPLMSHVMDFGSENFFSKGPDSEYSQLYGSQSLCALTQLSCYRAEATIDNTARNGSGLRAHKPLFIDTET